MYRIPFAIPRDMFACVIRLCVGTVQISVHRSILAFWHTVSRIADLNCQHELCAVYHTFCLMLFVVATTALNQHNLNQFSHLDPFLACRLVCELNSLDQTPHQVVAFTTAPTM
jgi:hypothetical protein